MTKAVDHATITTPGGEKLVLMPLAALNALYDELDAARANSTMAALARGEQELLTTEEVKAALLATTPLAFWRKKRGLTQTALAIAVGITQSYVAALEAGDRKGDPGLFLRLAHALNVRMEDLVEG